MKTRNEKEINMNTTISFRVKRPKSNSIMKCNICIARPKFEFTIEPEKPEATANKMSDHDNFCYIVINLG